jgi:predicted RNase H-like HicB family nuclease
MSQIDTYTVVGEPAGEDNRNAFAIELPGVIGNGDSFDEAVQDWTEALALHFATGGPPPEVSGLQVRQIQVVRPTATATGSKAA